MGKMQLLKIYSPRIWHTGGVKLLHKVGTVKEGLVFSKMLNLGEDVCGLHGAKYARTFGCLITFF